MDLISYLDSENELRSTQPRLTDKVMMNSHNAEFIRKKYKYRRLILAGKIVLPHNDAARLLGPDCAYHLYSIQDFKKSSKPDKAKK